MNDCRECDHKQSVSTHIVIQTIMEHLLLENLILQTFLET